MGAEKLTTQPREEPVSADGWRLLDVVVVVVWWSC